MSLDGKVIIVTGAGGNLGAAIVAVLARGGARIVAADLRDDAVERSLAATGAPARHVGVAGIDLAEESSCAALVTHALERFGRIDGLATTVGGFAAAPLAQTDSELLLRMLRINAVTTLNIVRAVAPSMRTVSVGSLVMVGAASALHAGAGIAAYAAGKSAALRMVESFADELRSDGVRVNAVTAWHDRHAAEPHGHARRRSCGLGHPGADCRGNRLPALRRRERNHRSVDSSDRPRLIDAFAARSVRSERRPSSNATHAKG